MERITLFADVLLPLPLDGSFTYRVPYDWNEFLQVGHRVAVQFGRKKIYAGIVKAIHQNPPKKGVAKYLLSILDEKPLVNDMQLKFWDWMADYYENIEKYPVKSGVKPGEILSLFPDTPPEQGEPMGEILKDFEEKIIPGMTHWQSPDFFAYFPANSSYPSVLAEMLTATLGAQCMVWETSPAAAELEEKMMQWLH